MAAVSAACRVASGIANGTLVGARVFAEASRAVSPATIYQCISGSFSAGSAPNGACREAPCMIKRAYRKLIRARSMHHPEAQTRGAWSRSTDSMVVGLVPAPVQTP
ncbi:hypothetical protein M1Q10_09445 [Pseudomonas aeruginosa]|uniref:hypothetical protein n=1 Tax=Pseudomonas aeruginosa TaxID=287 RepID=UPI0020104BC7|nr:hypothetical protein [Pseudomonas aeruginosa]UPZ07378.1 hypothetical protein M1Q10_09445 [Pseudomonas aeruginosa]